MLAKEIKPYASSVIVKLLNTDEIYDELILQDQSDEDDISTRYGEVISIGPEVLTPIQCSTLSVGDIAVFTEFAGHYLDTEDSESLFKVLRGFDIIAVIKEVKNMETLTPTGNRLVVEVKDIVKSDIIISNKDPKKAALTYGEIKLVGKDVTNKDLTIGKYVGFPPYVGTTVRHYESDDLLELRVIVDYDILFTV